MEFLMWRVLPAGLPKLAKHCGKCGHTHFISSGRFRVNANGSRIDIWLIWKCERCKATWNMDIISRVRADHINRKLYERFLANDEALALNYALDNQILNRSGAVVDMNSLIFEVEGEIPPSGVCAHIDMRPMAPLGICATRVIAYRLGISQSAIRRLIEEGLLKSDFDIRKKKLGEPISFILYAGWDRC